MTLISSHQPKRTLGPFVQWEQLNLICWGLLLVGFVLPFSIFVIASHRPPDGDFTGFYSLGRIAGTHPLSDLYDYELLKKICTQVHPRRLMYGPLPYPPQVGLLFAPFALLPYGVAYILWLLITLALYAAGLRLVINRFLPLDPPRRSLLFFFAFAYCPFLIDTAASGQLTAIGVFALSLVLSEQDKDHQFRSGLALSLCIYKPTLLVLLLPMLLVTRRLKTLLGFAAGAAALCAIPTAIAGFSIWPVFLKCIFSYGKDASGSNAPVVRLLVKYIDFSSFSALVHGGRSPVGLVILFSIAAGAALSLLWFWWKTSRQGGQFNMLLWATTITWTMLLNLYVPIYDSAIIVLSLILTVGVLRQSPAHAYLAPVKVLSLLILAGSWFTVLLAGATGVQLLTLLFTALGILQFAALRRFVHP
jgi:hypothetical protein